MSLNFHSYVIAEPQIIGLFGERGLGISSLKFSVMFTLVNSTEGDPAMYIDGLRATVSALPVSGGPRYLGAGEFEGPHILRRHPYSEKLTSLLRLDLGENQLVSLDEFSGGGGMVFLVTIKGMAHSPQYSHAVEDALQYRVNLSHWTEVMGQLEFRDAFVVGVEIPANSIPEFTPALQFLRAARRNLATGEYDAVVSICRQALDSLAVIVDGRDSVLTARASKPARAREHSKLQRALAIFESVRNYSHLAHHVDELGRPEIYSRREASMILTTTCTLVAAAMEW
ncbi:UNVERIFIED_ORG: hypothetical protein ABIC54_005520 [Burkholderia sp. 1263]